MLVAGVALGMMALHSRASTPCVSIMPESANNSSCMVIKAYNKLPDQGHYVFVTGKYVAINDMTIWVFSISGGNLHATVVD